MESVEQLTKMSERELDLLIAEYLVDEDFGSREDDDEERLFIANRWLSSLSSKLRAAICGNDAVKSALANPGDNNQLLAATIVDALLIAEFDLAVPVTVLAVKVTYVGITKICSTT